MPIVVDFCSIGDRCSCGWWVLDLRTLGQSRGTEMSLGLFQQYTNIFIKVESAAVTSTNWAKVNWCLKFDSHGKPNMKSFLMKFVFRINGGINFYFVAGTIDSSENSMLLLLQGWLMWHHFVLACFAPRSVDVGLAQYSIFVFLVLSRERENVAGSRFPCLISGVGRFSRPSQAERVNGWERRGKDVLNVGAW